MARAKSKPRATGKRAGEPSKLKPRKRSRRGHARLASGRPRSPSLR